MSTTREPPFSADLLRLAYAQGFFPMPHPDTGEIVWLSPQPRAVLPLDGFHASRSLKRQMAHSGFAVSLDQDFRSVMLACAARKETWITPLFVDTYCALHDDAGAHSVEVWQDGKLVGGTYGVALGGAFFAESMFHTATGASKVALHALVERMRARGMALLEVQFLTPHLRTLGAVEIPREEYLRRLRAALRRPVSLV
jgi:leucyl/phenylalanyl-tRNA--protein transferase